MSQRHCCSRLLVIVLWTLVSASWSFPTLEHIKPRASDKAQGRAVVELLKRVLGNRSTEIVVSVNRSLSNDTLDVCELRSTKNNKIVVTGSTGVAAASGIYNYLKYFCNCHVSWSGQQLDLPRPLPKLSGVLRINTPHRSVTLSVVDIKCVYTVNKPEHRLFTWHTCSALLSFQEISSEVYAHCHVLLKY